MWKILRCGWNTETGIMNMSKDQICGGLRIIGVRMGIVV